MQREKMSNAAQGAGNELERRVAVYKMLRGDDGRLMSWRRGENDRGDPTLHVSPPPFYVKPVVRRQRRKGESALEVVKKRHHRTITLEHLGVC